MGWNSKHDYALLGFIVAIFIVATGISLVRQSPLPVLFGTLGILLLIPFSLSIRSDRLDPFEPIVFYTIFTTMISVAVFDRAYISREPWQYDIISYSIETGVFILLLAYIGLMVSTLIGYYSAPVIFDLSWLSGLVPKPYRTNTKFLRTIGIVYMFLGGIGFLALLVTALSGNPFAMYTTSRPRSRMLATSAHWMLLIRALPIGYLLCLSAAVLERRSFPIKWASISPLVISLFILTGSRGRIISTALLILIFFFYCFQFNLFDKDTLIVSIVNQTNRTVWAVLGGIVAAFAAVGLVTAQVLRRGQSVGDAINQIDILSIVTAGVPNESIEGFLVLTQLVPSEQSYYYGTFYIRVLLNFIPRAIWPQKPVLTPGAMLRRRLLPEASGGRPPGDIGEYYINFGYGGILLLGTIFGIIIRIVYEFLKQNRHSPLTIVVYSIILITIGNSGLTNNALFSLAEQAIFLGIALVGHQIVIERFRLSSLVT